jgi:hypothetical protein
LQAESKLFARATDAIVKTEKSTPGIAERTSMQMLSESLYSPNSSGRRLFTKTAKANALRIRFIGVLLFS